MVTRERGPRIRPIRQVVSNKKNFVTAYLERHRAFQILVFRLHTAGQSGYPSGKIEWGMGMKRERKGRREQLRILCEGTVLHTKLKKIMVSLHIGYLYIWWTGDVRFVWCVCVQYSIEIQYIYLLLYTLVQSYWDVSKRIMFDLSTSVIRRIWNLILPRNNSYKTPTYLHKYKQGAFNSPVQYQ